MASTGTVTFTTAPVNTTVTSYQWVTSGADYYQNLITRPVSGEWFRFKLLDINVPAGATVTGIVCGLTIKFTSDNSGAQPYCQLQFSDGAASSPTVRGTQKQFLIGYGTSWPNNGSYTATTQGTSSDVWGLTGTYLTDTFWRASDGYIGIRLGPDNGNNNTLKLQVSTKMTLNVTYTPAAVAFNPLFFGTNF